MAVPSQDRSFDNGRVNQKRRTRAAIVAAAQQLLDGGTTPTVAEAAEAAMVSRTTAYRYFPTQESLLLELSLTIDVPEIEALVADARGEPDSPRRLVEVFDVLNRHVLADEVLYRRALRAYMDMWLAANEVRPDESPTIRAGRRTRWISELLEPLRATMEPSDLRRMQSALALVGGVEAMVVMRDVCGLDTEEALEVTRWATEAILATAARDKDAVVGRAGIEPATEGL